MPECDPLLHISAAPPPPVGTLWSSVFALLSTMLGAGILSLPATMASVTVVPDIFLFVAVASLTYITCHACFLAASFTGQHSYETVAATLFGPTRQWFVRLLTLVKLFGVLAVFVVVAMDMLHPFVATIASRPVVGIALTAFTLPFCLTDTLYALRHTNAVVVGCVLYTFVVVAVRAAMVVAWPATSNVSGHDDPPSSFAHNLALALPVQAMSFGCQINSVRIYGELVDKSLMPAVNGWSLVFGFVFYVAFSLFGFVCFQGFPPPDILMGFATDDWLVNSVRLALGVSMVLKIPLLYQPFFEVVHAIATTSTKPSALQTPALPAPTAGFRITAAVLTLAMTCATAIAFKNLSVIMGFMGATGSILFNVCVPGMFLVEVGVGSQSSQTKYFGVTLVVAGLAMSTASLVGLLT
ncbi:Aste57867_21021 [Aphanomyces stellatus]|uniref:Aste57867_21021 protein n=1 Tax=Aphanomyces stellatus TaxID=120398 RepID=A0A485LHP6_9STRA|nr:hypothetical protein As57867_020953 [Aphanomyces stellatus]VFT97696.1 Aste57867_21021 [Aphanomyces stellatus]